MPKQFIVYLNKHRSSMNVRQLFIMCRDAAQFFVGEHDFTHFANSGNPDPNPMKTIKRFDILPTENGVVFQVEGSGFMYKMVCLSGDRLRKQTYPHGLHITC